MKKKTVSFTLTLIFLFTVFFMLIPLAALAVPVGKITHVEGNVDITKAGAAAEVVRMGDLVSPGDILRAKSKAKAEVTFDDGNILRLAENTRVRITKYPMAEGKDISLDLFRGKTQNIVKGLMKNSRYEVHTPTAVCGVRGTDFFAFFQNGVSGALPKEGTIYFYNPAFPTRVVSVTVGQGGIVPAANQFPIVRPATALEIEKYLMETKPTDVISGEQGKKEEGNQMQMAGGSLGTDSTGGTPPSLNVIQVSTVATQIIETAPAAATTNVTSPPLPVLPPTPPTPTNHNIFQTPIWLFNPAEEPAMEGVLWAVPTAEENRNDLYLIAAISDATSPAIGGVEVATTDGYLYDGYLAGIPGSWSGLFRGVYNENGEIGYVRGNLAGEISSGGQLAASGTLERTGVLGLTDGGLTTFDSLPMPDFKDISNAPGATLSAELAPGIVAGYRTTTGGIIAAWGLMNNNSIYTNITGLDNWNATYGASSNNPDQPFYMLGTKGLLDQLDPGMEVSQEVINGQYHVQLTGNMLYMDTQYMGVIGLDYQGTYDRTLDGDGTQGGYGANYGVGTYTLVPLDFSGTILNDTTSFGSWNSTDKHLDYAPDTYIEGIFGRPGGGTKLTGIGRYSNGTGSLFETQFTGNDTASDRASAIVFSGLKLADDTLYGGMLGIYTEGNETDGYTAGIVNSNVTGSFYPGIGMWGAAATALAYGSAQTVTSPELDPNPPAISLHGSLGSLTKTIDIAAQTASLTGEDWGIIYGAFGGEGASTASPLSLSNIKAGGDVTITPYEGPAETGYWLADANAGELTIGVGVGATSYPEAFTGTMTEGVILTADKMMNFTTDFAGRYTDSYEGVFQAVYTDERPLDFSGTILNDTTSFGSWNSTDKHFDYALDTYIEGIFGKPEGGTTLTGIGRYSSGTGSLFETQFTGNDTASDRASAIVFSGLKLADDTLYGGLIGIYTAGTVENYTAGIVTSDVTGTFYPGVGMWGATGTALAYGSAQTVPSPQLDLHPPTFTMSGSLGSLTETINIAAQTASLINEDWGIMYGAFGGEGASAASPLSLSNVKAGGDVTITPYEGPAEAGYWLADANATPLANYESEAFTGTMTEGVILTAGEMINFTADFAGRYTSSFEGVFQGSYTEKTPLAFSGRVTWGSFGYWDNGLVFETTDTQPLPLASIEGIIGGVDSLFQGTGNPYTAVSLLGIGTYVSNEYPLFGMKIESGSLYEALPGVSTGSFDLVIEGIRQGDNLLGEAIGLYSRQVDSGWELGTLASTDMAASLYSGISMWQFDNSGTSHLAATKIVDPAALEIEEGYFLTGAVSGAINGAVSLDRSRFSGQSPDWGIFYGGFGVGYETVPAASWAANAGGRVLNIATGAEEGYWIGGLGGNESTWSNGTLTNAITYGSYLTDTAWGSFGGNLIGVYDSGEVQGIAQGTYSETPLDFGGEILSEMPSFGAWNTDSKKLDYETGTHLAGIFGRPEGDTPLRGIGTYSTSDASRLFETSFAATDLTNGLPTGKSCNLVFSGLRMGSDTSVQDLYGGLIGIYTQGNATDGYTAGIVSSDVTGTFYPGIGMWTTTGGTLGYGTSHQVDSVTPDSLAPAIALSGIFGSETVTLDIDTQTASLTGEDWGIVYGAFGGTGASGTSPLSLASGKAGGTLTVTPPGGASAGGYWLADARATPLSGEAFAGNLAGIALTMEEMITSFDVNLTGRYTGSASSFEGVAQGSYTEMTPLTFSGEIPDTSGTTLAGIFGQPEGDTPLRGIGTYDTSNASRLFETSLFTAHDLTNGLPTGKSYNLVFSGLRMGSDTSVQDLYGGLIGIYTEGNETDGYTAGIVSSDVTGAFFPGIGMWTTAAGALVCGDSLLQNTASPPALDSHPSTITMSGSLGSLDTTINVSAQSASIAGENWGIIYGTFGGDGTVPTTPSDTTVKAGGTFTITSFASGTVNGYWLADASAAPLTGYGTEAFGGAITDGQILTTESLVQFDATLRGQYTDSFAGVVQGVYRDSIPLTFSAVTQPQTGMAGIIGVPQGEDAFFGMGTYPSAAPPNFQVQLAGTDMISGDHSDLVFSGINVPVEGQTSNALLGGMIGIYTSGTGGSYYAGIVRTPDRVTGAIYPDIAMWEAAGNLVENAPLLTGADVLPPVTFGRENIGLTGVIGSPDTTIAIASQTASIDSEDWGIVYGSFSGSGPLPTGGSVKAGGTVTITSGAPSITGYWFADAGAADLEGYEELAFGGTLTGGQILTTDRLVHFDATLTGQYTNSFAGIVQGSYDEETPLAFSGQAAGNFGTWHNDESAQSVPIEGIIGGMESLFRYTDTPPPIGGSYNPTSFIGMGTYAATAAQEAGYTLLSLSTTITDNINDGIFTDGTFTATLGGFTIGDDKARGFISGLYTKSLITGGYEIGYILSDTVNLNLYPAIGMWEIPMDTAQLTATYKGTLSDITTRQVTLDGRLSSTGEISGTGSSFNETNWGILSAFFSGTGAAPLTGRAGGRFIDESSGNVKGYWIADVGTSTPGADGTFSGSLGNGRFVGTGTMGTLGGTLLGINRGDTYDGVAAGTFAEEYELALSGGIPTGTGRFGTWAGVETSLFDTPTSMEGLIGIPVGEEHFTAIGIYDDAGSHIFQSHLDASDNEGLSYWMVFSGMRLGEGVDFNNLSGKVLGLYNNGGTAGVVWSHDSSGYFYPGIGMWEAGGTVSKPSDGVMGSVSTDATPLLDWDLITMTGGIPTGNPDAPIMDIGFRAQRAFFDGQDWGIMYGALGSAYDGTLPSGTPTAGGTMSFNEEEGYWLAGMNFTSGSVTSGRFLTTNRMAFFSGEFTGSTGGSYEGAYLGTYEGMKPLDFSGRIHGAFNGDGIAIPGTEIKGLLGGTGDITAESTPFVAMGDYTQGSSGPWSGKIGGVGNNGTVYFLGDIQGQLDGSLTTSITAHYLSTTDAGVADVTLSGVSYPDIGMWEANPTPSITLLQNADTLLSFCWQVNGGLRQPGSETVASLEGLLGFKADLFAPVANILAMGTYEAGSVASDDHLFTTDIFGAIRLVNETTGVETLKGKIYMLYVDEDDFGNPIGAGIVSSGSVVAAPVAGNLYPDIGMWEIPETTDSPIFFNQITPDGDPIDVFSIGDVRAGGNLTIVSDNTPSMWGVMNASFGSSAPPSNGAVIGGVFSDYLPDYPTAVHGYWLGAMGSPSTPDADGFFTGALTNGSFLTETFIGTLDTMDAEIYGYSDGSAPQGFATASFGVEDGSVKPLAFSGRIHGVFVNGDGIAMPDTEIKGLLGSATLLNETSNPFTAMGDYTPGSSDPWSGKIGATATTYITAGNPIYFLGDIQGQFTDTDKSLSASTDTTHVVNFLNLDEMGTASVTLSGYYYPAIGMWKSITNNIVTNSTGLTDLLWSAKFSDTADYAGGGSSGIEGIIGGIDSLWNVPGFTLMGKFTPGEMNTIWGGSVESHQIAGGGKFFGVMGGNMLSGHESSTTSINGGGSFLYIKPDPDGEGPLGNAAGFLTLSFTGTGYNDVGIWEKPMGDSVLPVEISSDIGISPENLMFSLREIHLDFPDGALAHESEGVFAAIPAAAQIQLQGEMWNRSDKLSLIYLSAHNNFGIWGMESEGSYDTYATASYFHLAARIEGMESESAGPYILQISTEGNWNDDGSLDGYAHGYWGDRNTGETHILSGRTIGAYNDSNGTFGAESCGVWLETTKFISMLGTDNVKLVALGFPTIELACVVLSRTAATASVNIGTIGNNDGLRFLDWESSIGGDLNALINTYVGVTDGISGSNNDLVTNPSHIGDIIIADSAETFYGRFNINSTDSTNGTWIGDPEFLGAVALTGGGFIQGRFSGVTAGTYNAATGHFTGTLVTENWTSISFLTMITPPGTTSLEPEFTELFAYNGTSEPTYRQDGWLKGVLGPSDMADFWDGTIDRSVEIDLMGIYVPKTGEPGLLYPSHVFSTVIYPTNYEAAGMPHTTTDGGSYWGILAGIQAATSSSPPYSGPMQGLINALAIGPTSGTEPRPVYIIAGGFGDTEQEEYAWFDGTNNQWSGYGSLYQPVQIGTTTLDPGALGGNISHATFTATNAVGSLMLSSATPQNVGTINTATNPLNTTFSWLSDQTAGADPNLTKAGIWQSGFYGTVTDTTSGGPYDFTTTTNDSWRYEMNGGSPAAEHYKICAIYEGGSWANNQASGTVTGFWIDARSAASGGLAIGADTPATGIMAGEVLGTFDPNKATYQVVATGAWMETAAFVNKTASMTDEEKRVFQQATKIPAFQVGQVDLVQATGTQVNNLTNVRMDDVRFFAPSTGDAPRIWATGPVTAGSGTTGGVNGNYVNSGPTPGGTAVTLSGALPGGSLSAQFGITSWGDGKWSAGVNGSGSPVNSYDINFKGGAAGSFGSGRLNGTGAGVVTSATTH